MRCGGSGGRCFSGLVGAGAPLCRLARLGGTGGSGAGGAWGLKKGCVACWPGSLSGGSAGVFIFAFAWLRMMSASFARSLGDLMAMAVRPSCRRRGGEGGSSS